MYRKRASKKVPLRPKGKGDWTVPGYNYLGPGNRLDDYPATNEDDAAALTHDKAYDEYISQGQDPYWNYNEADQEFLDKVGTTYPGKLAWAIFQLKKGLSKAQILGTLTSQFATKYEHGFRHVWIYTP